jgi:hypothetical protein
MPSIAEGELGSVGKRRETQQSPRAHFYPTAPGLVWQRLQSSDFQNDFEICLR